MRYLIGVLHVAIVGWSSGNLFSTRMGKQLAQYRGLAKTEKAKGRLVMPEITPQTEDGVRVRYRLCNLP